MLVHTASSPYTMYTRDLYCGRDVVSLPEVTLVQYKLEILVVYLSICFMHIFT